jgi:hypothetical protein
VLPKGGVYGPLVDTSNNTGNVYTGNVWANGPKAGRTIPGSK